VPKCPTVPPYWDSPGHDRIVTLDEVRRALSDAGALMSVEDMDPAEVIKVACDALVAGLDSQALRELAGLAYDSSEFGVLDLLEQTLEELNLPRYELFSEAGWLAALKVHAARCVSGEETPREFYAWLQFVGADDQSQGLDKAIRRDTRISSIVAELYERVAGKQDGPDLEKFDSEVLAACRQLFKCVKDRSCPRCAGLGQGSWRALDYGSRRLPN
jgi:hypothetical protein